MALTRLGLNQSVNLASNVTGTLPTANGGTGATSFTAGKVLQVVSAADSTERSTSSATFSDIVSASITPSSTSNKVLVVYGVAGIRRGSSSGYMSARVTDGASFTQYVGHAMLYTATTSSLRIGSANGSFLHDANTTSAKTYTVQFNSSGDSGTVVVGDNGNSKSTITLMEIAG